MCARALLNRENDLLLFQFWLSSVSSVVNDSVFNTEDTKNRKIQSPKWMGRDHRQARRKQLRTTWSRVCGMVASDAWAIPGLDPFATGVLVVLVGNATPAAIPERRRKEYEAVIRFGYATDTGDITGRPMDIDRNRKAATLREEDIEGAMARSR